jgi:hypothetical protein
MALDQDSSTVISLTSLPWLRNKEVTCRGIVGISEQRVEEDTSKPQRATKRASQMVRGDNRLFAHGSLPKMELGVDDPRNGSECDMSVRAFDCSILDRSASATCLPAAAEGWEL